MPGTKTTDTSDGGRSERAGRRTLANGQRLTADARRSQLLDVALQIFSEHGYAAATMDDIAEAAGVTKPLLYQHFESKRALYLELVDDISEMMVDAILASHASEEPRQKVELGFAAYFRLMVEHESAFRLLYGRDTPDDTELGAGLRRVEDTLATAIGPLIDAGLAPEHRLLLAHAVVGMAEGASRHWLDERRSHSTALRPATHADAERLAKQVADLAWAGLRQVRPT